MPEPGRMDRTILRLPVIRGAVFLLFVSSAWAVGIRIRQGLQVPVRHCSHCHAFLLSAPCLDLQGPPGRAAHHAMRLFRNGAPRAGTFRPWPRHFFKIEQDKAFHAVQSVLTHRADRSEAPLTIWRREMDDLQEYVRDRCVALGIACPADLGERVIWSDRQSLLARDYASSMALHLARIVERAGGAVD